MNEKKEYRDWVFSVLFLIVLGFAGYFAWLYYKKLPDTQKNVSERTLSAAPLIEREVMINKNYIGYVKPVNEVIVRPYISGFIDKVVVKGGAEVKTGDILVILEQSEYKAQLEAAKASVAQAQATFDNNKIYYQRMQKAGKPAVSQTDLDNAKAAFLSSKAALEQAKASQNVAEVNFNYTLVKATIDGIIGDVSLSSGDYISPQSSLMTIIQYNPMRVVFSLTDKDYLDEITQGEIFANENISLKLANGKIYTKSGVFRYTDNQIDKNTNSIAIYADFENPQKELVANAYVDVLLHKKYHGMIVAKNLVLLEPEGNFIYVAGANGVVKRAVDIIADYGVSNYILKNTFHPGESIILDKITDEVSKQKFKIIIQGSAAVEEKN